MSSAQRTSGARQAWSIEPPIPEDVMTLLIFGGAFDPPHKGHVELPARVVEEIDADWLLYVPAAHAPLKKKGPIASGEDRLAMLKLAIAGHDRTSVTDAEIVRGGTSYTLDTLRQLRGRLPDDIALRLLIGADQAASFHRWRAPDEVIELAEPVVMLRPPEESAETLLDRLSAHWPADELLQWESRIVEMPIRNASSTRVREILRAEGPQSAALERLVPAPVLRYIAERGLYADV